MSSSRNQRIVLPVYSQIWAPLAPASAPQIIISSAGDQNNVASPPIIVKSCNRNSELDPHIKISGRMSAVSNAREKILNVLDTKSNRVTLKMDVAHTEHSHVIGKGGNNIKTVMKDTGCHIHFPDSNRNNTLEKSNQVSLAGQPHGVESARAQIRELLPLVFMFELPIAGMLQCLPDANSPTIQQIQQLHNVSVIFKQRPRVLVTSVLIRGTVNNAKSVKEATAMMMDHLTGASGVKLPVSMTLEIAPQHHLFILGRGGSTVKQIMQQTGATIHFPDPNTVTPQRKGTVYITGGIENVFLARQRLIGCLPLVLMFDVKEEQDIDQQLLTQLQEQLDVFLSIKPKPKQTSKSVIVKSVEHNASNLFEARRIMLGQERDDRIPVPNYTSNTTNTNENIAVGLNNLSLLPTNLLAVNMMNNLSPPQSKPDHVETSTSPQWMSVPPPPAVIKPLMVVPTSNTFCAVQNPSDFYAQLNAMKDLNSNNALIRVPSPSEKGASSTNSSSDSPIQSPCSSPIDLLSKNLSIGASLPMTNHIVPPMSLNVNAHSTVFVDEIKKISPNNSASTAELMSFNKPRPLASSPPGLSRRSTPPGLTHPSVQRESPVSAFHKLNPSPIHGEPSLLLHQNVSQLFGQLPNGTNQIDDCQSQLSIESELSPDKRAPGAERPSPVSQLFNNPALPFQQQQQQQQQNDYEQKKLLATKAMQKKPEGESRIPTDFWSGLGFSKSMPDSEIRDRLKKQNIKNYKGPSAITEQCENEVDLDPWKDSPFMNGASANDFLDNGQNCSDSYNRHHLDESSRNGLDEISDMEELFSQLGLSKYSELFKQQEIDMSTFVTLTDLDLKELGITTFGARRKMLLAIAGLNKSSPPGNRQVISNSFMHQTSDHRGISPPVLPMLIRRNEIPSQSGRW
ncbi:protein bicaudal C homolog 1-B-like isoform X2 [Tubulanus polymorphus]|uniref:protein bicaudal C homolog 1-B-like isoform X2 n=1 Tax=Tubulanus polymorphus TaxID=672921 RepID=UPI003DA2FE45